MKLAAVSLDLGLAVRHAVATEKGPPDAAGNTVVASRDRDVHDLPSGHRHRGGPAGFSSTARPYPAAPAAGRQGLCLSLSGNHPWSPPSRIVPVLLRLLWSCFLHFLLHVECLVFRKRNAFSPFP